MTKIGYARVSTRSQRLDSQTDRLKAEDCLKIFEESAKGGSETARPQLHAMLGYLRSGDVVVVTKLDRLARSLKDLLNLIETLEHKGAHLQSLDEGVNTATDAGRLMVQVLGMLAEFERNRIRERTIEGLEAARARGRVGGRPLRFNAEEREEVKRMREDGKSLRAIARLFRVSVGTVVRTLERDAANAD